MSDKHNHLTRDIKDPGECPGCDVYHRSQKEGHRAEPLNGGESGNGGENKPTIEELIERSSLGTPGARQLRARGGRTRLARLLEAAGHGQCAQDLETADDSDVEDLVYEIAEHVEEACGDFDADPELAAKIRAWQAIITRDDLDF